MLKCPLSGENHCHLRIRLVAGFDDLKVSHGSPGLHNGGYSLPDGNINPVPEGEKGIGYHYRPYQSCSQVPRLRVELLADILVLKLVERHTVPLKAQSVTKLGVRLHHG